MPKETHDDLVKNDCDPDDGSINSWSFKWTTEQGDGRGKTLVHLKHEKQAAEVGPCLTHCISACTLVRNHLACQGHIAGRNY